MHEGTWNKWREAAKPQDWKIMTKVEHTKRTAEYLALVAKQNPKGMRRLAEDTSRLPPIVRPAALPMNFEPLPEDGPGKVQDKKKRKRRKPAKSSDIIGAAPGGVEASADQNVAHKLNLDMDDVPQNVQPDIVGPTNKKKRKRRKSGKPIGSVDNATSDVANAPDDEPEKKKRG